MWFWAGGDDQYSKLRAEILTLLQAKESLESDFVSTILGEYESALIDQVGLLEARSYEKKNV